MMEQDRLAALMARSADQTVRARLAQSLLSSLGLRSTSSELVVPLGSEANGDNAAALCTWLDREGVIPGEQSPQSLVTRLRRQLSIWEVDQWDG